jgi:DNA-binding transcriptional MerR regulator
MIEEFNYMKGKLANVFGVSRDTLRYYENKGIINPKQNVVNNYREYDYDDIYTLFVADFYKKRGLSINQVKVIKEIQSENGIDEVRQLLEREEKELEESIRNQKLMLKTLKETIEFSKTIENHINKYCIKELPLYEVNKEFSDFSAFEEYSAELQNIKVMEEDILSKIMRNVKFDETGRIIDTGMYIVNKVKNNQKKKDRIYLEYPKCAYTIVEDGRYNNDDDHIMKDTSESSMKWIKEQGAKSVGVAFAITRLITYKNDKERIYVEIFVPIY